MVAEEVCISVCTHGIEGVAIFTCFTRAEDAAVGGDPKASVRESEVVADSMDGDAGAEVVEDACAFAADAGKFGVDTVVGFEGDDVEIVVSGVETDFFGGFAGVTDDVLLIFIAFVEGGRIRHAKGGCEGGFEGV